MMNHKQILKEIAKFASGLICGDFLVILWLKSLGQPVIMIWGIGFTQAMLSAAALFDVVLFLLLVHYGWRANIISPSIKERSIFRIIGIIFALVAIAHLIRIAFGSAIDIGSWHIPLWVSWVGFAVTAFLSYASFHFASEKH